MYIYVRSYLSVCLCVAVAPAPHFAIPTRIYVCDDMYVHICIYTFVYMYLYSYVQQSHLLLTMQFQHESMYVNTCMYIYVYMCSCICIYMIMFSSRTCSSHCNSNAQRCSTSVVFSLSTRCMPSAEILKCQLYSHDIHYKLLAG